MTLERGGGLGKGGPLCQLPRAQMPIPLPSPSSGSAHHPRPSQAPFPKLLIPISQRLFLRERHHTAPSTPLSGNSANQPAAPLQNKPPASFGQDAPEPLVPSGHLCALARKQGSQEKGGRTQDNFQKPGRLQTAGKLHLVHSPPRKSFNNTARPATPRSSKFRGYLQDGSIPAAGNKRFGAEAATTPNLLQHCPS